MKRRKTFERLIAYLLIFLFAIAINVGEALAANRNTNMNQQVFEQDGVKVTMVYKDSENLIASIEDSNTDNSYSVSIRQSKNGEFYSKTFDKNNELLNTIVKVGDNLVQYDTSGNIVTKLNLSNMEYSLNNNRSANNINSVAGTWGNKIYLDSDIVTDLSNQANVASLLITGISWALGVGGLTSFILGMINALANYLITNHIKTTYYTGWKQYGWEYGYYMVRFDLNFYSNSNHTGFIKNIAGTAGVH